MPYKDSGSPAAKASQARRAKKWKINHPNYYRDYQRMSKSQLTKIAWKKRNPDYTKRHWESVKARVFAMYGDKCAKCGFSDKRALQLDHVNDDGCLLRVRKDGRRTSKTQPAWYDALKIYQPKKYQILCANCNWIKRYESMSNPRS